MTQTFTPPYRPVWDAETGASGFLPPRALKDAELLSRSCLSHLKIFAFCNIQSTLS